MTTNHYKSVNIRDINNDSIGILLRSRSTLIENQRTLNNTVRGFLKTYGIRLGGVKSANFSKVVREAYEDIPGEAKLGIESLVKSYEEMLEKVRRIEKTLNEVCKGDEKVKCLMTIPGVGMIVAMTYRASMGDPTRFKKSEAVGAYYGMTPRQYSSGETVRLGGISRCGSKEVRTLLTEAATSLLTRVKSWSSLKAWGLKIQKKHGFKKAVLAVGRKLAVIMHRMLMTGESFRFSHNTREAA